MEIFYEMGLEVVKHIQVLLAAYNGQSWLNAQLDSLSAQDDADFSVLMQDDGSTDGTRALLEDRRKADGRFRMAGEQGCHLGAIGNFISLLRQSDAPYCALCDQDDEWLPERLSVCRKAMEDAEARWGEDTPILVHSDALIVDAEGKTLHESFFAHQGWDADAVQLKRLIVQNNVTGCTVLMNAALRRLVVAYANEKALYMHDWFIALTAAAFGRVVCIRRPLVRYRQHGNNVMGASRETQVLRGLRMLNRWKKGRERITLTYTHARAFGEAVRGELPPGAARVLEDYLATEGQWKPLRVLRVMRGGYTMQSRVTRLGQILFG